MKNLQTWFLKIPICLPLIFSFLTACAQPEKIKPADSLFQAKQYTQSLVIYKSVFDTKKYSPSMLLKMAYINEGLGRPGATLYFLKLYHLATDDEQALKKVEEISTKFGLTGYETTDANRISRWMNKWKPGLLAILALLLFVPSVVIFLKRNQEAKPKLAVVMLITVVAVLFYFNNFISSESVIINNDNTYLMEGPSAGAPVAAIVGEGNQLDVVGREDVWLKVKWVDKVVYVKENSVMAVAL